MTVFVNPAVGGVTIVQHSSKFFGFHFVQRFGCCFFIASCNCCIGIYIVAVHNLTSCSCSFVKKGCRSCGCSACCIAISCDSIKIRCNRICSCERCHSNESICHISSCITILNIHSCHTASKTASICAASYSAFGIAVFDNRSCISLAVSSANKAACIRASFFGCSHGNSCARICNLRIFPHGTNKTAYALATTFDCYFARYTASIN